MNKLLADRPAGIAIALVAGALASWFSDSWLVILSVVFVGFIVGTLLERNGS